MYTELLFTNRPPAGDEAYVGGGAKIDSSLSWPKDETGTPLMHLMAAPSSWFGEASMGEWISIFIPYVPNEVSHYAKLRARDGKSAARVVTYKPVDLMRNEFTALNLDAKAVVQSECDEVDDDENLASKIGGVLAWLQKPISVPGYHYAMAIYGGDLDEPLSPARGILSDGLGYLFLADEVGTADDGDVGRFFLQLG